MAMTKEQFYQARRIVTGMVRGSYVNVINPRFNEKKKAEEFSMELLIDKKDEKTVERFKKARKAVMEYTFKGKKPLGKGWIDGFKDGDKMTKIITDPQTEEEKEVLLRTLRPEIEGKYVVRVATKEKPAVVDYPNRNPIDDPSAIKSGDFFRVAVNAHGYGGKGTDLKDAGITYYLDNVQFLKAGEGLGGGVTPDQDFEEELEEDLGAFDDGEEEETDGDDWE